ncbi:MAG: YlmC/YmxH family sporulation protein [Ruminococcus sp.]|nr:YlmC/YmxH family sporulation protein [Ruminococcus sp.]
MLCSLDELRRKEVIDISTGERLGYIDDVRFDLESASVEALLIYGRARLFGIFGRDDDIKVPCSDIKVVGSDVVLISRTAASLPSISPSDKKISVTGLFK